MQFYPQVETAKELMELLHMSPSAFKRKFYEAFGTSAKQWMIQKKKEKLLRDIVMTNLSIIELAEKYKLTANYLTTFCKRHFGKTPKQLRTDFARSISESRPPNCVQKDECPKFIWCIRKCGGNKTGLFS